MSRRRTNLVIVLTLAVLVSAIGVPAVAQVDDDFFEIAYGVTVSDGVPGPGAGNIEVGGSVDSYSFEAEAGDVAIFDVLTGNAATFRWALETPGGDVLFNSIYTDRSDELTETGTYVLTVFGSTPSNTGTYSLRVLLTPAPEEFTITFGDTVSDGVPQPGAGNIEVPGAVDTYLFDATAGDVAVFDALTGPTSGLRLILRAPDGAELLNLIYADREATLPQTGTYTLSVSGLSIAGTGAYSFRLLAAPASQEFTIAIGDTVSDGVPEPGAGNIEAPGAVDRYLFDADAGQVVIFDALTGSTNDVRWRLEEPDGTLLFDVFYVDQEVTLPQTGIYTLIVDGQGTTGFGTYSFQLLDVPAQVDEFTIAFGDIISDGVPEPGAGNLEGAGALDRYLFDAVADQVAIFDVIAAPTTGLHWTLQAPDGTELFSGIYSDQQVTLPQTGTYTLEVSGLTVTGFGTYSFQLSEAPPNNHPVAVDDEVETDHGLAVTIDVLANDTDPDGDILTIGTVTQPANGNATTDGSQVTYTPDVGFSGLDSFTYSISDGQGGTAQATVTVTVHRPPNNPPAIEEIPDQENTVGDRVVLQVEADDPDSDSLTYTAGGLPPGLDIDSATGEITGTIEDGAITGSPYDVDITVSDPDGATATTAFQWTVHPADDDGPVTVEIDILLPCLLINGFGIIPVVIFGNDQVDGADIDVATVELEGLPVKRVFGRYLSIVDDYNGDGVDDRSS